MSYVEQYAEMLKAKGRRFAILDGQLFARHMQWIAPIGPVATGYTLADGQTRSLLRRLGGWWVSWTGGFQSRPAGDEFFAVVRRGDCALEALPSANARRNVRRGMRNCEVCRVEAEELAITGYETFQAALRGYGGRAAEHLPSAGEFQARVLTDAPWSKIKHHWVVKCEGKVVAFASVLLYDTIEADYTMGKFHPAYLKYYVSYALFQWMNEYYLGELGMTYVNAGSRSVLHDTGIQEFLVNNFAFEKAPLPLHLSYRQPLGLMLGLTKPLHRLLRLLDPRLSAVLELHRLRAR